MNQLHEILDRGVPEPPPLDGLAARAERRARRTRGRRRAGLAGGVAAAVAAALVVPALVGGAPRNLPASPEPPSVVRTCGAAEPADELELTAGVAYVRFCPTDAVSRALVPNVALTTKLRATVVELNEGMSFATTAYCALDGARFVVQVGYLDGTAVAYDERDGCGVAFFAVMGAIADQESHGLPDLDLPALTCPPLLPRGSGPAITDDDFADSPLTSLRADSAVRCTYDDPFATSLQRTVREPEELRLAVLGARFTPGPTECAPDAGRTDRIERLLLRLVDGSVHVVEIDHCGQTTIDRVYVGVVPESLLRGVARLGS